MPMKRYDITIWLEVKEPELECDEDEYVTITAESNQLAETKAKTMARKMIKECKDIVAHIDIREQTNSFVRQGYYNSFDYEIDKSNCSQR
jgi:predicted sugar kinase